MIRWAKPETIDYPVVGMDVVEVFVLVVVVIDMARSLMALVPYRNTSIGLIQCTIKGWHRSVFISGRSKSYCRIPFRS
jgi:hypothetical protein